MILFGLPIAPLNSKDVRSALQDMLKNLPQSGDAMRRAVVTPNPEMLLKTEDDHVLFPLQRAQLHLPDGVGLQWATGYLQDVQHAALRFGRSSLFLTLPWFFLSLGVFAVSPRFRKRYLPERITGTDTIHTIADLSVQENCSIYLLGSHWPDEAATALHMTHPGVQIAGTYAGTSNDLAEPAHEEAILSAIKKTNASILLVAFGAPAQEHWLARNLEHLPQIRLAMGVGGAFDMLTGHTPRAPKFFRRMGLEWLWRLFLQPKRLPRILNATIRFPFRCLRRAFHMALHGYRKNVIVFAEDDAQNFLLVESNLSGPADTWQFVQEGLEQGESIEAAALRGLQEEVMLEPLPAESAHAIPDTIYAYEWPKLSHTHGRLPGMPTCVGQVQQGVRVRIPGIKPLIQPRSHEGKKELRTTRWVSKNEVRATLYPTLRLQYDAFAEYL